MSDGAMVKFCLNELNILSGRGAALRIGLRGGEFTVSVEPGNRNTIGMQGLEVVESGDYMCNQYPRWQRFYPINYDPFTTDLLI